MRFVQRDDAGRLVAVVVGEQYFHGVSGCNDCRRRGGRGRDMRATSAAAYHCPIFTGAITTCTHGFARTPSASTRCNGRNCRRRSPRPGEVLIEIKAASLNFPDLLIVQNKYQIKPPLPFVPGSEYAGVVAAVGEGVTQLKVGQSVACLSGTGGFATHTIAPAALCMPLPPGFPHVDAAAFIMIYATSHHALVDRGAIEGRRDRAGAGRGRRRRHLGDPDRQGRWARASSPRRRPTRSASCASRSAPTRRSTTAQRARPARGDQGGHRRQGPGRDLRPGRRRLRRAGVPLHRLARPLPGGRLRLRPDSRRCR